MQNVALGLLWWERATADIEQARRWQSVIPRIYVIDARPRGEAYSSLPDIGLHYAPYRQKVSLGTALNRALALAFEEGKAWLWLVDTTQDIDPAQLLTWSQKASRSVGLYQSGSESLWRRPSVGLLVSVAAAHAVGGWNTALPAPLVLADFQARLRAAGFAVEAGPDFRPGAESAGFDFAGGWRSLWTRLQKP